MTADPAELAMLAAVLAPPRGRGELLSVRRQIAALPGCDRQDEPNGCGPFILKAKCFPCQRAVALRARERELAVEDDLPRLLYADFLDERSESAECPACHGRKSKIVARRHVELEQCPRCRGAGRVCGGAERAEFIRTQISLARIIAAPAFRKLADTLRPQLGRVSGDVIALGVESREDVAALRRRERELLTVGAAGWLPPPFVSAHPANVEPPRVVLGGDSLRFRRGFVDEVELDAAAFLRHADALTAAAPLRRVRFTDWPQGILPRPCGVCPDCTSPLPAGRCEAVRDALAARWPLIEFELPVAESAFRHAVLTRNLDFPPTCDHCGGATRGRACRGTGRAQPVAPDVDLRTYADDDRMPGPGRLGL